MQGRENKGKSRERKGKDVRGRGGRRKPPNVGRTIVSNTAIQ
jgi:hypothetical protein